MFDRLDDILIHYEELMQELNSPSVTEDQNRFRRLMKEQADLAPLVETYREYKKPGRTRRRAWRFWKRSTTRNCGSWPRRNCLRPESGSSSWNSS